MKVNFSPIEITKSVINVRSSLIKDGEWNNIHEHMKLEKWVYRNEDRSIFKLVLEWVLNIKTGNKAHTLVEFEADHEMIIQKEGLNDKEELINVIRSSELNFEMKLQEALKNTLLSKYKMKWIDYSESAEQILELSE